MPPQPLDYASARPSNDVRRAPESPFGHASIVLATVSASLAGGAVPLERMGRPLYLAAVGVCWFVAGTAVIAGSAGCLQRRARRRLAAWGIALALASAAAGAAIVCAGEGC